MLYMDLLQTDDIINIISNKIKEEYVYEDKGNEIYNLLKKKKFKLNTKQELVENITKYLQTFDKHFKLKIIGTNKKSDMVKRCKDNNYGFTWNILSSNIGYIKCDIFCIPNKYEQEVGYKLASIMNSIKNIIRSL